MVLAVFQLLPCLVAASCASSQLATRREQLLDTDLAWSQAMAQGELERGLRYWADDAILYPVDLPEVSGKAAIQKFLDEQSARGLFLVTEPRQATVVETGDSGYTMGLFDFRGTTGNGQAVSSPGHYLALWRRSAVGSWTCTAVFHTPLSEATPLLP